MGGVAIRADGTRVELEPGSPVYQGDVLQTETGGAIEITFIDDTAFTIGEEGRMVLDELVFDPETNEGSSSFSVVQGVFSFVSGAIAKTGSDAMTVRTPVATIGIRGTQVAVQAAAEYHHGDLRHALINAALVGLEEGGTGALSLRGLAERVGVSRTAPYRHFAGKKALLAAVAASGFVRFTEALRAAKGRNAGKRLAAIGRAYCAFARQNPGLLRLMFGPREGPDRSSPQSSLQRPAMPTRSYTAPCVRFSRKRGSQLTGRTSPRLPYGRWCTGSRT